VGIRNELQAGQTTDNTIPPKILNNAKFGAYALMVPSANCPMNKNTP
jgi:hypothetical protein